MPGEPSEINISATGSYPVEMPESLREALAIEVQRHMEGYGCKNVVVKVTASHAATKQIDLIGADYFTPAGRRRLQRYVQALRRRVQKLAAKLHYMQVLDRKISSRLAETSPAPQPKDSSTGKWVAK